MLGLISCAQNMGTQWQEQYDLGVRYLSEGNYKEAIIAFTAAIEIDPMKADAYLSLAEVYMVDDSAEEAANILKRGYEATGEVYFIEKIKETENAQLPVLTEEKMNDFIWAYSLLEAEDYSTLCREGDQMYADRQYVFPFDEYIGLCFDGTRLYRYGNEKDIESHTYIHSFIWVDRLWDENLHMAGAVRPGCALLIRGQL